LNTSLTAPLPPNLGLIAVTQMAIGTSVLWMWLALMSLVGLYKPKGTNAKQKRVLSSVKACFRSLSSTSRKLVVYGQAMGLVSVIIVSLAVFFTIIMNVLMKDTGQKLGSGTYRKFKFQCIPALLASNRHCTSGFKVCCGPLIFLSSQGFSPGPKEVSSKKRGLRLAYGTCFCLVLLPVKLFGWRISTKNRRGRRRSETSNTVT
jgi:hypothetical protein